MSRFTIRDMLLVTIIAGLALGWWLDRTQLAQQRQTAWEGSYELIVGGSDHRELFLFNPRTGETWKCYSNGKWLSHAWTLADSKKQ